MADKQMFAARDFRYGTRMLRAGEPVTMDASHQRLYTALGAVTATAPARAKPAPVPAPVKAEVPAKPKKKATRKTAKKS